MIIQTERLILRQWRDEDRDAYFALNSDPEVRRFFPFAQTREETDLALDNLHQNIDEKVWGLWALELKQTGELVGMTGLWPNIRTGGARRTCSTGSPPSSAPVSPGL